MILPDRRFLTVVLIAAIVTAVVKRTVIGDPRWWNLLMAVFAQYYSDNLSSET